MLTIDTTPPLAPKSLTLLAADDSGTLGDGLTNVRRPRFIGVAEPGASINLNGAIGSTTASVDGSFVIQPTFPLSDGAYNLSVSATDAAGNSGNASTNLSIRILSTIPLGPTISLAPADDTGTVGDGLTAVRLPRFLGSTSPGGFVELLGSSGQVIGSTTAAIDGSFTVAAGSSLGLGSILVSTRVRDQAGNQGTSGALLPIRIIAPFGDFAGGGTSSLAVIDPQAAIWTTSSLSGGNLVSRQFGWAGVDRPIVGDFNGDGKADYAVFRPTTDEWFINDSSTGVTKVVQFGAAGIDLPVPADYDGDGKTDIAVYRPTTAQWFIQSSLTGQTTVVSFGWPGVDLPLPADYDGDGKADIAVYRPPTGEWFIKNSSTGNLSIQQFGWPGVDMPIPADYDGDGKADFAVFRPSTAEWFIQSSLTGLTTSRQFGWPGVDQPVPADYEGIGKADLAVFRPPTAEFFVSRSGASGVVKTALGTPGVSVALLKPQIYRLDGLRPVTAATPASHSIASTVASGMNALKPLISQPKGRSPSRPAQSTTSPSEPLKISWT